MSQSPHSAKIIETKDGSSSLFSEQFQTSYHSVFGAIEESKHVFMEQGLKPLLSEKNSITILEIGFGTGLNALLTFRETANQYGIVNYHTVEMYPVSSDIALQLDYAIDGQEKKIFDEMHLCEWDLVHQLTPDFQFIKYQSKIEDFKMALKVDVIYFDAFSPTQQPELWSQAVFENMYAMLKEGGHLVTYCAQGQMKRNLKAAGFTVKALPGFANKREMTVALKNK